MQMNAMIDDRLMTLFDHLFSEGGTPLLVGGCVRDQLLHRQVKDLDVVVFGMDDQRLRRALEPFGQVLYYGRSFSIYQVRGLAVEFSLPRTSEGSQGTIPLEKAVAADARHRDFTINALYLHPFTQQLLDPLTGLADLQDGRLRMATPRAFEDDPLRVYRAFQLISRLGFSIEPTTLTAMKSTDTRQLPSERLMDELDKWLLADDPLKGWQAMALTGHWPPPQVLTGDDKTFFVPGWQWHTPAVLAAARHHRQTVSDALLLMWAALMAPLLAVNFTQAGSAAESEKRWEREERAERVKRLEVLVEWFRRLSRHHGRTEKFKQLLTALADFPRRSHRQPDVVRLCLLTEPVLLEALLKSLQPLWRNAGAREMTAALRRFQKWKTETPPKPCITGNDLKKLGVSSDSTMGVWLRVGYEMQLEGVDRETVIRFLERWKKTENE